jgi:hypothetical protein
VLAQRFGITEQTVYKWKKRDVFADRSHTAHRLQTVLTPAQETVVVHLRRTLLLPLDDLLAVTREFICPMSHARAWIGACAAMERATSTPSSPRACGSAQGLQKLRARLRAHGCEVPAPDAGRSKRRYLFVAIDRATRWVFVQFKANKTAASAGPSSMPCTRPARSGSPSC